MRTAKLPFSLQLVNLSQISLLPVLLVYVIEQAGVKFGIYFTSCRENSREIAQARHAVKVENRSGPTFCEHSAPLSSLVVADSFP